MNDKMPTLEEIKASHAPKVEYERHLYASRFVFRPPSFGAVWLAVRLGLTSEGASWLSGIAALAAYACLLLPSGPLLWPGVALLALFNLLDCLDGGIARIMKTRNPYGRFLDSIMNWADMMFWGVIGVVACRLPELRLAGDAFGVAPWVWPAAGGAASLLFAYYGYLEKVFDEILRPHWDELRRREGSSIPVSHPLNALSGGRFWAQVLLQNLRVRETHYLLLIPACLAGALDLLLAFFLSFYAAYTAVLLRTYCRRGREIYDAGLGRIDK